MRNALKVLLPAAALALGLGFASASAAPAGLGLGAVKTEAAKGSVVEAARLVRQCKWYRGRQLCRLVWVSPRRHKYKKYYAPRHRAVRPYGSVRRYR